MTRVTAVIVAYNREELLRETLAGLAGQRRPVDEIVVVNNASTDNSAAVVREVAPEARLITLTENTGGAGGFAVGMAAALAELPEHDPDWIWVMDDDTVPGPEALAQALEAVERDDAEQRAAGAALPQLAVLGSRVVWTDGQDHPMNTPKEKIGVSAAERARAQFVGGMAIRSISFVSAFVRAGRVRELGLPIADYFLWNDDFEFSARVLRGQRGLYVPESVVTHKTKVRGSSDADPGARFYFEVRNKLWVFLRSDALSLWEKTLYSAASVRRWFRTFRSSQDRAQLRDCLRRGWRDGWRTRPRGNRAVLAPAGVPAEVLERIGALE